MKRFIYVVLVRSTVNVRSQEIYPRIWTECPVIAPRSQERAEREELELRVNPLLQKDPEIRKVIWGVKFQLKNEPMVQEKNPKFIV